MVKYLVMTTGGYSLIANCKEDNQGVLELEGILYIGDVTINKNSFAYAIPFKEVFNNGL